MRLSELKVADHHTLLNGMRDEEGGLFMRTPEELKLAHECLANGASPKLEWWEVEDYPPAIAEKQRRIKAKIAELDEAKPVVQIPATNYDEIFTVLRTCQEASLEAYRRHIADVHAARDSRKTMVDLSPAVGQITIEEQEHLQKAIDALEMVKLISKTIENAAVSEQHFATSASMASAGNKLEAENKFLQSSDAMALAASRVEHFASYAKDSRYLAESFDRVVGLGKKLDPAMFYHRGLKFFSSKMKTMVSDIKNMGSTIQEKVNRTKVSLKEAVSSSISRFTSKVLAVKEKTLAAVIDVNDKRAAVHQSVNDSFYNILSKCVDAVDRLDQAIVKKEEAMVRAFKEASNSAEQHISGAANVVNNMVVEPIADRVKSSSKSMADVAIKLNEMRQNSVKAINGVVSKAGELYVNGKVQAAERQDQRHSPKP